MTCCVLCSSTDACFRFSNKLVLYSSLNHFLRDCSVPQILWCFLGIFVCLCGDLTHSRNSLYMFQPKHDHMSSTKPAAVAGAQGTVPPVVAGCSKNSQFSVHPLLYISTYEGFFIFIFCFFLQRACSFGGFDLTNRSLHPLISDNDNTVCNSHSSINSTDRIRSLFIYLPLFCFLRV